MNRRNWLFILIAIMIIITGCSEDEPNYTIQDNSVLVDDDNVYINVTPHTRTNSGIVYAEFESKVFGGNVDIAIGFIEYQGATPKWLQYQHPVSKEWINLNPDNKVSYDHADMDTWYYTIGLPINAGQRYKLRYYIDVPFEAKGKYTIAIKTSSETIQEAVNKGHFYMLDPWYDFDLNRGLLAYYSFDIDHNDNYIYERNGTLVGATIGGDSCILDNCYFYDGTGADNITNPDTPFGNNHSISFWWNVTDLSANRYFTGSDFNITIWSSTIGGVQYNIGDGSSWGSACDSDINIDEDHLYHMVAIYNTTGTTLYINNTQVCSVANTKTFGSSIWNIGHGSAGQHFQGYIDEVGIWNRSLTTSEISGLWNNGNGLGLSFDSITINNLAIKPDNPNPTTGSLNCSSVIITGANLDFNATLNWTNQSNGILETSTSFENLKNGTGISENLTTTFNFNDIWNCTVFAITNTSSVNTTSSVSKTILGLPAIINSTQFSNKENVTEGEDVLFSLSLNITNSTTDPFNIYLILNNTLFSSSQTSALTQGISRILNYTSDITIPDGFGNNSGLIKPWNWSFSILNTVNNYTTNHTNITIFDMGLDDCTTNNLTILNFTVQDEENRSTIGVVGIDIEGAVNITSKSDSSINFNFSGNVSSNSLEVCLPSNALNTEVEFWLNSITKYTASDHVIEYYNIQNATVSDGFEQNITLFPLQSVDNTDFRFTFTGSDFLPVENALVNLQRQYIATDQFITVELPKTDSNGQTVLHMVRNDIIYNIRVIKNGEVLGNFENIIAFCADFTIGDCTIDLNAFQSGEEVFDYDDEIEITYTTPTYDNNTGLVSFTFSTIDGTNKEVSMEVISDSVFGNRTLCTNSLESSGGTLSCNVGTELTESTIVTVITVNGIEKAFTVIKILVTDFGVPGFLVLFFMMLSLIMVFADISKTLTLVSILIGFTAAAGLSMISSNVIGQGASILWIIIIIVILIWKSNRGRPE